jgi:DNA-binding MarR family transcriptional regulator
MIAKMGSACLLMRTRLISRVVTGIYDEQLRPFAISSAQFALLVGIYQVQPATRAEIARQQHLDRSTLTRHLRSILSKGWAEESRYGANGRSKPIVLTPAGTNLLHRAEAAWEAAQVQAKDLLGKDGIIAAIDVTSRIMEPAVRASPDGSQA